MCGGFVMTNRQRMVLEDLSRFLQIHNIKFERVENKVMLVDSSGDVMQGESIGYVEINAYLKFKEAKDKTMKCAGVL